MFYLLLNPNCELGAFVSLWQIAFYPGHAGTTYAAYFAFQRDFFYPRAIQ